MVILRTPFVILVCVVLTGYIMFRDQHLILIVPTCREYVTKSYRKRTTFSETDYFKKWNSLLNEKRLDNILSEYEMKVLFCPHRNMSQFRTQFNSESTRIRILDWQEVDISNIIEKASLLITDYSSISMDFAYMKRPVLYYQFDKERFRNEHLSKSYLILKMMDLVRYVLI